MNRRFEREFIRAFKGSTAEEMLDWVEDNLELLGIEKERKELESCKIQLIGTLKSIMEKAERKILYYED